MGYPAIDHYNSPLERLAFSNSGLEGHLEGPVTLEETKQLIPASLSYVYSLYSRGPGLYQ